MNTNIKSVFSLIICLGWSLLSYTQDCAPQAEGETELAGGKVIISYGATTNSVTPKVASNILVGQAVIGQNNTTKLVAEYGFYTQFLLPPLPPTVTASQGELLDRIQVSWALDPLGSSPTGGFNLFRDGVFIESVGPKVRNFNDFNVIAGRPYTYSVSGINKFGEGSGGSGLGFQIPNGVVTGWVQTLNGRPVPDAQVTLLPMQGFSTKFGAEDGAVAIKDIENPFLPAAGEDWTMTFWMNTTSSTTNADVIGFNGSTFEIQALSGANGISVTEGGNILSSNFASNAWHHVTLAYEGGANTGRLYIDGALQDQSTMSNIMSPDSIYFGQVLGSNGWTGLIDEFRIYHTLLDELDLGMVMEGTASSTTPFLSHYWKFDEELGEKSFDIVNRHQLYFCGAQFDEDRPLVRTAGISNEDGFYLIEGVSYGTGTTFKAEAEKNFYLRRSLDFTSSEGDYVSLPDFALPSNSTIELVVNNTNAGPAQTILSKIEGSNTFKIYCELSGGDNKLKLDINGTSQSFGNLPMGFNHLAFTIDSTSGQIKGYINGGSPTTKTYSIPSNWSDLSTNWYVGVNSSGTSGYFNGLIDELAVYDHLLSASTILSHAQNPRDLTEDGLTIYFPMDEGNGNRVNNVGSTLLDFGTIQGAEWSNFAANQETTPHEFSPKTRQVTLNPSVTSVDQVDFTDLSTIPVSGYVRFQGTECFQPQVEILVNGASFSPKIFTDEEGKFLVDFDPGFSGILTPKYENHTYSPASWEVSNVTSPIAGILFNNTVKRKISGKVVGGLCELSILNEPGTPTGTFCTVKVSTPDGCLERIHTFGLGEENGDFEFNNLPPVEQMVLAVVEHSDPNIKTYFEVSGGSILDISLQDTVKDMIYFAPPEVNIVSGLDPYSVDCDLIVLDQGSSQTIKIKLQEFYLGEPCELDTGYVSITNDFSDEKLDTTISNGSVDYVFKVGEPNPSPPHLKTLQVVGTSLAGRQSSVVSQALITGIKNKENTFTSKLPNTPILVLRDPPGDGSSAYFEKGETICQTTEINVEDESGGNVGGVIFSGGDVEIVAAPLGVGTISNSGVIFDRGIDAQFSLNYVSENRYQTCLTTNERIATSDDDLLPGPPSDIFMGTATNIIFGFADVITFDETNCVGDFDVIFNLEPDSDFKSTYLYSRFQIENYVIPNLTIAAEQETDPDLKLEYENSILEWTQILTQTEETAEEVNYDKNISFNAGVEYEYFTSNEILSGSTLDTIDTDGIKQSLTTGYQFNEFGFNISVEAFTSNTVKNIGSNDTTSTVTIGYTLYDDDPGDAFSVDIGVDNQFKTNVYKLIAGQSSCPWEEGTANREGPNLQIVPNANGTSAFEAVNIPANEPAVFQFLLGNGSATNEDVTYGFTSIAANNPHGAIIKLNGQPLNYVEQFIVPFGESIPITVTVERGPIEYEYNDLLVAQISECEYDRNLGLSIPLDANPLFFSGINISASFIRPCSEVNINVPQQDWVLFPDPLTPGPDDVRRITVSGYDTSEVDFKLIRLQFRNSNGDGAWINIGTPEESDIYNGNWKDYDALPDPKPFTLQPNFTQFFWNTVGLADGYYEIRAVAECTGDASDKPGFSQIIKGKIDREAPTLFGVPQPSDGVYHVGDEISFTFNQDVDCNKLIQADMTQVNNVGLYDATTNQLIDATISCIDNKIIIDPNFVNEVYENNIMRAELHNIKDLVGNNMIEEVWEFYVDRNELAWLTDSIELTKYNDETKTISAKIHNRGGYPVPYTIQSIPDWVHVSPDAGTLVANEIEEINFTVDETVPLGWLSDSIIMHTETGLNPFFMGGDEVLNMAARVICRPDKWIINPDGFDPSGYSFSMNFTLELNIEGVVSTDEQDLVGAYVDGQLRGVARLQSNPELGNYLAFLTVYSNVAASEIVEFQIWDASECKLFALILESFPFQSDHIIGSPLMPQIIHTDSKVLRKIFIHPGWNWISMNVDQVDPEINGALSSLTNPAGAYMKGQVDFSGYSLAQGGWVGILDTLSPLDMYQYSSIAFDSISMIGTLLDPATEILVGSGWNWIGYIPNEKLPIKEALSSLNPTDGDIIKSQVSFAQYVQNFGWIGNLDFLDAPNGYLLKLANADTLIYPDPQNIRGHNSSGNRTTPSASHGITMVDNSEVLTQIFGYWDVDPAKYEHNMNVIAIVKNHEGDRNILREGDEVAAFVDDEVRGSSKVTYVPGMDAYIVFMTVYADKEGELVTFKLYDTSESKVYDIEETTGFIINSILGEVDSPEPLHLALASGITNGDDEFEQMNVYPNPFASSVFVKFMATSSQNVEIVITDALSRVVETIDVKIKQGENIVEWKPVSDIQHGTYFINIKEEGGTHMQKVLYIR